MRPCKHNPPDPSCNVCKWCAHPWQGRSYRILYGEETNEAKCIHLGEETGKTVQCGSCRAGVKLKTFNCEVHGVCTPGKQAPNTACCLNCPDHSTRESVQIVVTADGIGDHILGLAASAGLKKNHPNEDVVYVARHAGHISWLTLGRGYDHLATQPLKGAKATYTPHDSYGRQMAEGHAKPRWEYYSDTTGYPCVLPDYNLPSREAALWARRYAGRVLLSPYSAWGNRTIDIKIWLELEQLLIGKGFSCLILDDQQHRSDVFKSEKLCRESPARVGAVIHAANCLIGNDSGMAHVAGLLRTPTIACCVAIRGEGIFGIYPTVHVLNASAATNPGLIVSLVESMTSRKAWDASLLSTDRRASLARAVREVALLEGDMAEVGVYKGGSAMIISDSCPNKTLHLFDTFSGLPEDDSFSGEHHKGDFSCSLKEVQDFLAGRNTEFHPGVFPETTRTLGGKKFSLVHLDGDTYQVTKASLEWFWPRMTPGGRIVLDDWKWGNCPGVEKALEEELLDVEVIESATNQATVIKPGGLPKFLPPPPVVTTRPKRVGKLQPLLPKTKIQKFNTSEVSNPKKVLFLDDSEERWRLFSPHFPEAVWVQDTKSVLEALRVTTWDAVYLDHDLAPGDGDGTVVAEVMKTLNKIKATPIVIHSTNGAGAGKMREILAKAGFVNVKILPFEQMGWMPSKR